MIEASIQDRLVGIERRGLFKITDADVIAEDDGAAVVTFLAGDDLQERRLAGAVLGNEPDLLTLGHGEADAVEENLGTKTLCQTLNI